VIDVTERKRAEEELRRSEMEFRQMLDLTPQLVGVFGPKGERLYANRILLDYLGTTLDEWRQTPGNCFSSRSFIHPDDQERAARTYSDNARSGGSAFELELRVRKGDGSYRWLLARYNPVRDDKGQVMRWYAACTDAGRILHRSLCSKSGQAHNDCREEDPASTSVIPLAREHTRITERHRTICNRM